MPSALQDTLINNFGISSFRPGQEAVISRLLEGHSVLAVFPPGAGKSLCYQLPAILLDGVTIVVSSLLALMKNQVEYLRRCGIPAGRLDSTLTYTEHVRLFRKLHSNTVKIVFISPQRMTNEKFVRALAKLNISLIVIDEAHCISEWGHNFRPDYLRIAILVRELGVKRVLALTTTATPYIAGEIRSVLGIREVDEIRTDFNRPNLQLRVIPSTASSKIQNLLTRIQRRPRGPSIVYVTRGDLAVEVAQFLGARGIPATAYHAGLDSELRTKIQDQFKSSDDVIVVATLASGIGIDKQDIRSIYHYNMPWSIEAYWQEIGRAGRDGENSICEMFPSDIDAETHKCFTLVDTPCPKTVGNLTRHLLASTEIVDISEYDLSIRFNVTTTVVKILLAYLELDGIIKSAGYIYSSYKCRLDFPASDISQIPESAERTLLESILQNGRQGPKWITLDVDHIAAQLGVERSEVISTVVYFESLGYLVLQFKSRRQRFRTQRYSVSVDQIIERMNQRFKQRQRYGLVRIDEIVKYVNHTGCRTERLLNYFGQPFRPCGHCDRCLKDQIPWM